jgi:hypothetical protein
LIHELEHGVESGKATKTVSRTPRTRGFLRVIRRGFFLGDQTGVKFYRFPTREEMEIHHSKWWHRRRRRRFRRPFRGAVWRRAQAGGEAGPVTARQPPEGSPPVNRMRRSVQSRLRTWWPVALLVGFAAPMFWQPAATALESAVQNAEGAPEVFHFFAPFSDPRFTAVEQVSLILVLVVALASLVYAYGLYRQVNRAPQGTPKMQEVAAAIREGANSYSRRSSGASRRSSRSSRSCWPSPTRATKRRSGGAAPARSSWARSSAGRSGSSACASPPPATCGWPRRR